MSNAFKEVIRQIKEQVDIVELIGRTRPLKKMGKSYKACCPFHEEKTPSFHVMPDKGFFHCFGCGANGSAIDFLMRLERLEFMEAVKRLAAELGIEIPRETGYDREESDADQRLRQSIISVNQQALEWFRRNLRERRNPIANAYLPKRGITEEIAERFQLGAALDEWEGLKKHLVRLGFSEDFLVEAGLCKLGRQNSTYDTFRNRLIFPIFDANDRVVGFGGRALSADDPAKYLNSPETALYKKSLVLYGLNWARHSIEKTGYAIICEGYMDAVMAHVYGFNEAVAVLGTGLTPQHAKLLKRYTNKVYFLYDGDSAGQNSMLRGGEPLLGAGLDTRVISLPETEDPDSFLRAQGADALHAKINGAEEFFDFALKAHSRGLDFASLTGQAEIVERLTPVLLAMQHEIMREAAVTRLLKRLSGLPREAITQILDRKRRKADRPIPGGESPAEPGTDGPSLPGAPKYDRLERNLLKLMVESAEALDVIRLGLRDEWITDSRLAPWIFYLHDNQGFVRSLIEDAEFSGEYPGERGVLTSVMAWEYPVGENPRLSAEEILRRLQERHQLTLTRNLLLDLQEMPKAGDDWTRLLTLFHHEHRARIATSGRFLRTRDAAARDALRRGETGPPPVSPKDSR